MINRQYQYTEEKFQKLSAVEKTIDHGQWKKILMPTNFINHFLPFISFEEFFLNAPEAFPKHTEKESEVITYMLDGGFLHTDDLGNRSIIHEDGVQRFTAGKGLSHTERPVDNGVNHGVSFCMEFSEAKKITENNYQQVAGKNLPYKKTRNAYIKTIVGDGSPIKVNWEIVFQDITLDANSTMDLNITKGHNCLLYLISGINGRLHVNNAVMEPGEGCFFEHLSAVQLSSKQNDARFLFLTANQPQSTRSHKEIF